MNLMRKSMIPRPHDLQTVIAKMKHYDSAIVSASGDFVLEHHRDSGIAKTQYALTFEGQKIRVEQERDFPALDKDVPAHKKAVAAREDLRRRTAMGNL